MDHKDVTAEKLILTFTIILPGQKATKTKGTLLELPHLKLR